MSKCNLNLFMCYQRKYRFVGRLGGTEWNPTHDMEKIEMIEITKYLKLTSKIDTLNIQ